MNRCTEGLNRAIGGFSLDTVSFESTLGTRFNIQSTPSLQDLLPIQLIDPSLGIPKIMVL